MNEKLKKVDPALDPDSPRTRSDVAPKQSATPARHISGLRPAVHLPGLSSIPPAPITPADLLEDGWDDDDQDFGPTLLDAQASVPREMVAAARAFSDPLGGEEGEEEEEDRPTNDAGTREIATRELSTRTFSRDEATTGEMPTVLNPIPSSDDDGDSDGYANDEDDEFSHDDYPTRQTPMGLQQELRAMPPPADSDRGLHETLRPIESTPDVGSVPMARAIALSSPDETAQMPLAPILPRLEEPHELPSAPPPPVEASQISQVSYASQASYPSPALRYPTPTSLSGAPLLPESAVRFAFLRNVSPNDDPPINRLAVVSAVAFFATLALSAFVAWVIVLIRH